MPTTVTLKNIPDEVYKRLRTAAKLHRRSLNSEAIVCLESALTPGNVEPHERLVRAREMRSWFEREKILPDDIQVFKEQGRP